MTISTTDLYLYTGVIFDILMLFGAFLIYRTASNINYRLSSLDDQSTKINKELINNFASCNTEIQDALKDNIDTLKEHITRVDDLAKNIFDMKEDIVNHQKNIIQRQESMLELQNSMLDLQKSAINNLKTVG